MLAPFVNEIVGLGLVRGHVSSPSRCTLGETVGRRSGARLLVHGVLPRPIARCAWSGRSGCLGRRPLGGGHSGAWGSATPSPALNGFGGAGAAAWFCAGAGRRGAGEPGPIARRWDAGNALALVLSADVCDVATGLAVLCPIRSKIGKLSDFEFPVRTGPVNGAAILSELRSLDYQTRSVQYKTKVLPAAIGEANRRVRMIFP
jgi:mRNA-degrading endonuclease toxin of MazEF toxin-antitoxin module